VKTQNQKRSTERANYRPIEGKVKMEMSANMADLAKRNKGSTIIPN
jgi:hypothetical protein